MFGGGALSDFHVTVKWTWTLTLSSMIQSRVMNKRSKVTKRQKVLLTSEMHFFSAPSYDSIRAETGVVATDPTPLPFRRESMLLHRLSIARHAPTVCRAGPAHLTVLTSLNQNQRRRGIGVGTDRKPLWVKGCGRWRETASLHLQRKKKKIHHATKGDTKITGKPFE